MANPTKLTWRAPATWGDNVTPFRQSDFKGWLVEADGKPAVSVPIAWDADGVYEIPLTNVPALASIGKHTVAMRTVSIDPEDVTKTLTSPASTTATYTITGTPLPPLDVAVA